MIAECGMRIAEYKRMAGAFLLVLVLFLVVMPAFASAGAWDAGDMIKAYIKNHYPWTEVEVADVRLSGEAPSQAPVSITVEKTPPGKSVFRLAFPDGRTITVSALIRVFDRVMMSRNGFGKGHTLTKDDVYQTLVENARVPRGAIGQESRLVGKTLTRTIVANVPLTDAMVSATALVKRGRRIVLSAGTQEFAVKTVGELKQDAMIGDFVKVLNSESRKTIMGQLVDENTVLVGF